MVDEKLIASIRRHHRDRCFMMDTRKIVDLRLGAHLRRLLGWRKDLPEDERKAIATEAARQMDEGDGPFRNMIIASHAAREIFAENEEAARKEMAKLAKQLPVWESFGKDVRGFGEVSLAVIVAEAGDLSDYATDAKLWKRMGLAVLDGARQGQPGTGATKDDWIAHGYSPKRRSHMWNIGQSLIKGNKGVYRAAYDRRRQHTMTTHPEWWCDAEGKSKLDKSGKPVSAHGAADAQRYMEKRLLRDLWRAWRRAAEGMAERPTGEVPAASNQQTIASVSESTKRSVSAKRRANASMANGPNGRVPAAPFQEAAE